MSAEEFKRKWDLRVALAEALDALDKDLFGEPMAATDPDQLELDLNDDWLPF